MLAHRGVVNAGEVKVMGAEVAGLVAMSRARQNLMADGPGKCIPDYSLIDGITVPLVSNPEP